MRLASQDIREIPEFPQLFVKSYANNSIQIPIVKVDKDMLIALSSNALKKFHGKITERFQIERYTVGQRLIFYSICINNHQINFVECDWGEYM